MNHGFMTAAALDCQVAEPQVSRLCLEAEEFIAMGKWLELASLMITSAELIFAKVSEKGTILLCCSIYLFFKSEVFLALVINYCILLV